VLFRDDSGDSFAAVIIVICSMRLLVDTQLSRNNVSSIDSGNGISICPEPDELEMDTRHIPKRGNLFSSKHFQLHHVNHRTSKLGIFKSHD
jgi:hypothetical protein